MITIFYFNRRLFNVIVILLSIILFICTESFSNSLFLISTKTNGNELATEWVVYDNTNDLYVPYLPNIHQNIRSVSLIINGKKFKGKKITFESPNNFNVFINNKLHHQIYSGKTEIDLDSLFEHIQEEEVLFTLYNEIGMVQIPSVSIVEERIEKESSDLDGSINSFEKKNRSYLKDLTIIFFILFLFLFGSFSQKKSPLNDFLTTDRIISGLQKRQLNESKIDLNTLGVFVIYCSLIFPIVIFVMGERFDVPIFEYFSSNLNEGFYSIEAAFSFLYLFLSAALFFVIKLIITLTLGTVYKIRSYVNIHLLEYIKVTGLLFSLMLFLSFSLVLYSGDISNSLIKYFIFFLLLLYFLFMGIRLNKLFVFNKFYLISYFCITEFIPIFLSLKFFIKF